jgi:hypothetical protein
MVNKGMVTMLAYVILSKKEGSHRYEIWVHKGDVKLAQCEGYTRVHCAEDIIYPTNEDTSTKYAECVGRSHAIRSIQDLIQDIFAMYPPIIINMTPRIVRMKSYADVHICIYSM